MVEDRIISSANPRIKRLVALRSRSKRDREGVFVLEGRRLLDRALLAGLRPSEIYYDPSHFAPSLVGQWDLSDVAATECSPDALSRASYRDRSEGVIAVFRQFDLGLDQIDLRPNPLILMTEDLEKPGNLGAVLRTADAVGADAVIAVGSEIDVFNPNVLRASTGALFTMPTAVADLDVVVTWLRQRSIPLIAADPEAKLDLWSADLTTGCALLVGSESEGLTSSARRAADLLVSLPMAGTGDSLNASVTVAVMAYEAVRQRRPHDH